MNPVSGNGRKRGRKKRPVQGILRPPTPRGTGIRAGNLPNGMLAKYSTRLEGRGLAGQGENSVKRGGGTWGTILGNGGFLWVLEKFGTGGVLGGVREKRARMTPRTFYSPLGGGNGARIEEKLTGVWECEVERGGFRGLWKGWVNCKKIFSTEAKVI